MTALSPIRPAALALAASAALLPGGLKAATTFTLGFDGGTEGFTTTNVTAAGLSAPGGILTGTATTGDPRLIKSAATPMFTKPADETWSTIVFRVRETDESPQVVTPFVATGVLVQINSANSTAGATLGASYSAEDSGDGFLTVTADISNFTANDILYLRLDPIGGTDAAGNKFEVDFIQINAVPEPSVALLGGLGMLALLRRRR